MTKERKNLHDKQFYTNMVMCPDLEQYHKNRAKESLRQLNLFWLQTGIYQGEN